MTIFVSTVRIMKTHKKPAAKVFKVYYRLFNAITAFQRKLTGDYLLLAVATSFSYKQTLYALVTRGGAMKCLVSCCSLLLGTKKVSFVKKLTKKFFF